MRTTPRTLIAQVAPFYPPHLGGVENVVYSLAHTLSRTHQVRVLTTTCGSNGAPRREHTANLDLHRSYGIDIAHTPLSPGLAARILALPRDTVVHAHVAQAFVPEVVWLTSVLRRRPYIIHFHLDVDPSGRLGWLLPAYKRHVFARALRGARYVIALSDQQAEFLARAYDIRAERLAVIPNGVDETFFMPTREKRETSTADPLRLLFVGRLDAQKNVARLIDAIAKVTEPVELVVAGDGQLREQLEAQRQALGLDNVKLVGAQRGDALLDWYRWAEAFVLPSDKEGMPLVLLEAMAAALPIVSTDVDGSREMLTGVGLLVLPTPEGLAGGIAELTSNSELRASLADKSAQRGRSSSWEQLVTKLEELYARL